MTNPTTVMGYVAKNRVGKYQLGSNIGEGAFAKVKLAIDTCNGRHVAIKIIDKSTVIRNNLIHQVQSEIKTMKLLHHPNIVRIYEVIGSKTKIYIVMEYMAGGQLSGRMSRVKKLSEREARKLFQQLIDAVDYCHGKGVYHRDLKPENLLLDWKGNLSVSDFGLSALRKPGDLLATACGSPSYVAPELLIGKNYDGAAADVWSCGVILFELLAGYLPFDDQGLIPLYKKIRTAKCRYPPWFTEGSKKLISRIFDPNPGRRITVCQIMEDEWFQKDYVPAVGIECQVKINQPDVRADFNLSEEPETKAKITKSRSFINAFQLIATSNDLDLSGLFEEKGDDKQKTKLGSKLAINETVMKIEEAAKEVSLSVERMNHSKVKMNQKQKITRCFGSYVNLSAEVIEVAPTHCVVEISKSAGELEVYKEFCKSLSCLLKEKSDIPSETREPTEIVMNNKNTEETIR